MSALIYEVVWQRALGLAFGDDIVGVTVVLVAYMAGLGFGGWYFGRRVDRSRNPLRLFMLLELGIAGTALAAGLISFTLPAVYRSLYWWIGGHGSMATALIFVLSTVVLFVPTALMGGTLPVLSRALIGRSDEIGTGVGRLYGFNTLGGVLGAVTAGFFLIPACGLRVSTALAAGLNAVIALAVWSIRPAREPAPASPAAGVDRSFGHPWLLILAGGAGLTGMAYEVLWFRGLAVYLTNATYSFTTILAVYLTGFGLGACVVGPFLTRRGSAWMNLFRLQMLIGLYALFSNMFIGRLPGVLYRIASILDDPVFRLFLPGTVLGVILMLVPTILMGAVFPLLVRAYAPDIKRLGSAVGRLYILNTLGSMAGPLAAYFILIPVAGVLRGVMIVALVNLALAVVTRLLGRPGHAFRIAPTAVAAAAAGLFIILGLRSVQLLPPSLYRSATRHDRVLYYHETSAGTVLVSEDQYTGIRACYVNNNAVCGTTYDALKVVKMLGHLPALIQPASRTALVIGYGIGVTTACLDRHGLERIDCVEIAPGVRRAAAYFSDYNNHSFRSPNVSFIAGDGRHFLSMTRNKYDIISCDPTHPILGCGALYTREYFELCRRHMNPGGVVCQYLPLHKLTPDDFRALVRTFTAVFPHATVWLGYSHGILMGSDRPVLCDFAQVRGFVRDLADDMLDDPYLLATSLMLDSAAAAETGRAGRLHTDDRLFLEFFRPAGLRRENWELNLRQLMSRQADPAKFFAGIPPDTLAHYRLGQQYFLSSLCAQNRGDRQQAIDALRAACAANPENQEIRRILEHEDR